MSPCGFCPGAGGEQAQAVEADDDGGPFVAEDAEGEREVAGEVPGDQGSDDGGGDQEVGGDDAAGAAGEGDHCGDRGEVVAHDDDVGGVEGEVGPDPAHGGAGAGGGHGGCIVDAVAGQQDVRPAGLEFADGLHLVFWQEPGADVDDAGLGGEAGRGAVVVAGQQDRWGAGEGGDPGGRRRCFGADAVGDAEHGGGLAVDRHDGGCLAVFLQGGDRVGDGGAGGAGRAG